jgi:prepilin-type N-terminal cleavage/methylation domain-containing protein
VNYRRQTKRQGFTLIESLIVVIIVGLLSAVGIVALGTAKKDAVVTLALTATADISSGVQRAGLYTEEQWAVPVLFTGDAKTDIVALVNALKEAGHFTATSAERLVGLIQSEEISTTTTSLTGTYPLNQLSNLEVTIAPAN